MFVVGLLWTRFLWKMGRTEHHIQRSSKKRLIFLFVSRVTYYSLFIDQMPRKRYVLITFASAKNVILHYQCILLLNCYSIDLNYLKECYFAYIQVFIKGKALGSLDWVLFSAVCNHSFV